MQDARHIEQQAPVRPPPSKRTAGRLRRRVRVRLRKRRANPKGQALRAFAFLALACLLYAIVYVAVHPGDPTPNIVEARRGIAVHFKNF